MTPSKACRNAGQTPDGSILAWVVSGPYKLEGKTAAELFNLVFEPEKAGSKADWRPVGQAAMTWPGLVDLIKAWGGMNEWLISRPRSLPSATGGPARNRQRRRREGLAQ